MQGIRLKKVFYAEKIGLQIATLPSPPLPLPYRLFTLKTEQSVKKIIETSIPTIPTENNIFSLKYFLVSS